MSAIDATDDAATALPDEAARHTRGRNRVLPSDPTAEALPRRIPSLTRT